MIFACNLAGCASFSIDKTKYYNEVLAKLVTHYTNKSVAEEVIDEIAKRIKVVNDKRKIGQELTSMEAYIEKWYYSIMANKPYYSVEEVKVLKLI